jgi:hypothetical protein
MGFRFYGRNTHRKGRQYSRQNYLLLPLIPLIAIRAIIVINGIYYYVVIIGALGNVTSR